jgi:predicted TIM-barrel fold metal-dependent hydrolase
MKKIDAHAHAFNFKVAPGLLTVPWDQAELVDRTEILLGEMDKWQTEMAVLHQAHTRSEEPKIQAAVRKYPKRFVGFCNWGWGVSGRDAAEYIQKWLQEPEFKGVGEALVAGFRVPGKVETIPEALKEMRIPMDVVREKKVPIIFHTGYSGSHSKKAPLPLSWGDPLILDEIAGEYWDVPFIIAHSGGHYPPYDMNALMMAYQHENVFLETSKSRSDIVEKAVGEIGDERILFGTDWVRETAHTFGAVGERRSHMYDFNVKVIEDARISDDAKEKIFYKNIKSLLRL